MIQIINISLIPSDNKPVINVSQYDNGLRVLRFNIFDDIEMEVPHEFDGETVTCNIRKNDNNIVVITGTIETETTEETETSYVEVVLTEQACACVGSNYGEISLSSGDDVIGTCNFKLVVERSPLAGGITSQSEIDNLTTQIEEIAEQVIGEDYYTKTETDNLLDEKADITDLPDMSDYYTKSETDNLLDDKADITDLPDMSDYYTKSETDNLLDDKADITDLPDMSDYYTKTETDNKIANLIDDAATVNNKTWSSAKISDELYALLPVGTVSGPIASFNTALVKPLVSLKSEIDYNANGVNNVYINYVDFNQLVQNGNFANGSVGWSGAQSTLSVNDGIATITRTSNYPRLAIQNANLPQIPTNHIIFATVDIKKNQSFSGGFAMSGTGNMNVAMGNEVDTWKTYTMIKKTSESISYFYFADGQQRATEGYTAQIRNVKIIDLTQALGSDIADYLYALSDNGLSIVKNLFTKDYYNYNVGGELVSLASVNDSAYPNENIDISSYNVYGGNIYIDSTSAILTSTLNADGTEKVTPDVYELSNVENLYTLLGNNNFFTNVGDITVQYKDTINNYIDTRVQAVQAVSNRSLSMLRTLETLEKSTTLERGETDDQK